jgi:hypothetical protein
MANAGGEGWPGGSMNVSQVRTLVRELRNITEVLADADLSDKAELYAELGIKLSYHRDGTVAVEALPRGFMVRVGGGL